MLGVHDFRVGDTVTGCGKLENIRARVTKTTPLMFHLVADPDNVWRGCHQADWTPACPDIWSVTNRYVRPASTTDSHGPLTHLDRSIQNTRDLAYAS